MFQNASVTACTVCELLSANQQKGVNITPLPPPHTHISVKPEKITKLME